MTTQARHDLVATIYDVNTLVIIREMLIGVPVDAPPQIIIDQVMAEARRDGTVNQASGDAVGVGLEHADPVEHAHLYEAQKTQAPTSH